MEQKILELTPKHPLDEFPQLKNLIGSISESHNIFFNRKSEELQQEFDEKMKGKAQSYQASSECTKASYVMCVLSPEETRFELLKKLDNRTLVLMQSNGALVEKFLTGYVSPSYKTEMLLDELNLFICFLCTLSDDKKFTLFNQTKEFITALTKLYTEELRRDISLPEVTPEKDVGSGGFLRLN